MAMGIAWKAIAVGKTADGSIPWLSSRICHPTQGVYESGWKHHSKCSRSSAEEQTP